MAKDLTNLFCPKSVAVIGASRSPQKVGAIVLKNIIESKFPGKIYPVNPNTETINNLTCFKNVDSLPEVVDLVVIAIPAVRVLAVLNEIGEKGIKNVVVLAAGFKESGAEGEKLEKDLVEISQKYNLNLLGPNCLGFVNNLCPINVTFGQASASIGNLRFISQSGAIAASLFDFCKSSGLGFSQFITLGNKAVTTESDVLEYFQGVAPIEYQEGLSKSQPIGLYLENISDGLKFLEIAQQLSKTDPIFILKPGKSEAGVKAMHSHTGAMASDSAVLDAVLNQADIIRCQTLEDFFDFSRAFAFENAPTGPKVAIISNAGGPAVISADAITSAGLELAQFDDQTRQALAQILPRSANILNPVDVLGDALADRFAKSAEIILQAEEVDALVVILTPQIMTQIEQTAKYLVELSKKYQKPILCSFIGGSLVVEGEKILSQYKIPVFRFPELAINALSAMWQFYKNRLQEENNMAQVSTIELDLIKVKQIIAGAKSNNQKTLDNLQANNLLSLAGILTPATAVVESSDVARNFAKEHGYPVVLKLSSPGLLHKKEIGGVIINILNEEQLQKAWEKLEQKLENGFEIQIQQDVGEGVEAIVGIKHDPNFGPVLLFGAGGSSAELIADKNLHLLPINLTQAQKLVEQSKLCSLLNFDLQKLNETIVSFGKLAQNLAEVAEMEINPLIITKDNVWAVDGKVILKENQVEQVGGPKFQTAKVVKHVNLASTYHYFEFETNEPLIFKPGQYISVKVASDRVNCYSIAGSINPNQFSLLIDISPGGPGSQFFEKLKVGGQMLYLGPFGIFTLDMEDEASKLLFLATGSGLAPLKCMIEQILYKEKSQLPIDLYLGLTSPKDLFCEDYLQNLARQYSNFHYKIVIWKGDQSWQGESGFITTSLDKDLADASDGAAYLCGNQEMIADATKILLEKNMPKERIYTEKYF